MALSSNEHGLTRALLDAWDDLASPARGLLPHQVPPSGDWFGWVLYAGRGAGKTEAASRWLVDHVNGPPCLPGRAPHWMGIIAPTLGDAVTSCVNGPSGILEHDPLARLVNTMGGTVVRWPNGSEVKLFGAYTPQDVERLRAGGNRCAYWLEELAAWTYLDTAFDHMLFGLRSGPQPRWVASTTPKPRALIKRLVGGQERGVIVTHATTYDNPYLPQDVRDRYEERYSGTTLGDQELLGRLIEQDENALWTRDIISRNRVIEHPDLTKVTVGVDPSGGAGEQGIVVSASWSYIKREKDRIRTIREGFTLADYSCRLDPSGWANRVVDAAVDFEADDICVEVNFGGDMAMSTVLNALEHRGLVIPVRKITASRGKRPRAEPVAAMAAQDRWHHVGTFPELEDQLTTWTPESKYSPDRLDASVWGGWHLRLVSAVRAVGTGSFPGQAIVGAKLQ